MSDVNVYRDGKVYIRAAKCDHCMLSRGRLVSGARTAAIVRETRTQDGASFVCHRNQVSNEPEAICRGWWDAFADQDPILRLAVAEGIVTEVDS